MSGRTSKGPTGCIEIDQERCEACELCVAACPKHCIEMGRSINGLGVAAAAFVRSEECTGCANCAESCPEVCIGVWR